MRNPGLSCVLQRCTLRAALFSQPFRLEYLCQSRLVAPHPAARSPHLLSVSSCSVVRVSPLLTSPLTPAGRPDFLVSTSSHPVRRDLVSETCDKHTSTQAHTHTHRHAARTPIW